MLLIPLTAAKGLGITRREMSTHSASQPSMLRHPAADRYAGALMQVLVDSPKAERESASNAVMLLLTSVRDADVFSTLQNPRLSAKQRAKFAHVLAQAVKAPAPLTNLLGLVARQGRLAILPDILAAIASRMEMEAGVVPAYVVAAAPLTDMQNIQLKAMIKAHEKCKDVHVHERVDAQLIGGFRVFFGGMVWDTSVVGKLARLKAQLRAQVNS
jgi:F-type H+-transporting ATPase subunit delta